MDALGVFSNPALEGFAAIPTNPALVEQVSEFLCAIAVEAIERSRRPVGQNVALYGRDQLFKGLVRSK